MKLHFLLLLMAVTAVIPSSQMLVLAAPAPPNATINADGVVMTLGNRVCE
ncbi:MAG: hypothetical protein Q7S75_02700 [bacterium]|nr:hypothetical protein [bacterium]